MALVVVPPLLPRNLPEMIWTFQQTPTTPRRVAALGADRAGDMGAVVVDRAVVDRVVVAVEVPAVDVVDVAVAVVVDAVDRVVRVRPDLPGEIGVREHDAFVDLAHEDGGRPGVAGRPRFAGLAAVLVGRRGGVAVHAPQRAVGVVGVVRDRVVVVAEVRLGVFDFSTAAQRADGGRRTSIGVRTMVTPRCPRRSSSPG